METEVIQAESKGFLHLYTYYNNEDLEVNFDIIQDFLDKDEVKNVLLISRNRVLSVSKEAFLSSSFSPVNKLVVIRGELYRSTIFKNADEAVYMHDII